MADFYTVLFIHQSSDLYGSDKTLLSLVTELKNTKLHPVVIVPSDGALIEEFQAVGVEYFIVPSLVRASRATFGIKGLLHLPFGGWKSLRAINAVLAGRHIDLVYSNTLAVLTGAFWSKLHDIQHVWHVHEIIRHPNLVRKFFAWMLNLMADKVICNSEATRLHLLNDVPKLSLKSAVVWNGLKRTIPVHHSHIKKLRKQVGVEAGDVLVVLMGRINSWKGQTLLIEAADKLSSKKYRNIKYLIIGSPPEGQEHYLESLKKQIDASPVKNNIKLLPFRNDIWTIWDACDIAVVPSLEPEPFGMVALEAMAAKKPVVASNHGGIKEIVVDKVTGFLFQAGEPDELAEKIALLAMNSSKRKALGENGYLRQAEHFNTQKFVDSVVHHCLSTINIH